MTHRARHVSLPFALSLGMSLIRPVAPAQTETVAPSPMPPPITTCAAYEWPDECRCLSPGQEERLLPRCTLRLVRHSGLRLA